MAHKMTILWESLVTLILFPLSVCLQMDFRKPGYILTSLLRFLSSMYLQIACKITSLRECLATLIWFLISMCLHMAYKLAIHWKSLVTLAALVGFSPGCVFKCVVRTFFCEKALSHWLHWYGFSPVCVIRCIAR